MSSVSRNNQVRLFRLPDTDEEEQHQQRPSYPQFFHNDDESDDGDIRTVKTNTSLTLHSIEDVVGQHSTITPPFDACNRRNDVDDVFPLPTQPNDHTTGITTLFPNSPFSKPTSSTTVQHVVVVEDDDEDFAADDEGEVSFRTTGTRSSRIHEQRHCYNRSVRPKKDSFVQASSRNTTSFVPIVTDWKNESTRKVVTPPAVTTTTTTGTGTGTSTGSTTTRTVSSTTSSQGSPTTNHDYRYNYLTDERIAIISAGETMRCRSSSSGGNIPINRSNNQLQLSESNTNSSYSSSCNTPSPNGKQQPFVVFNSPVNDTVVEPMLRNMTKSSDIDSEDNCLSSHNNDGSPFIDDENSYSFSLGGGNVSLEASPAAANPNYKNPFRINVPDTLSIPNRTTTSTISKASNQEHIVNEIDNNDIDDSNWIKTSWSYLQMMARKASSPLKFTEANGTKTNIDDANHHENSTTIVDLDETIASSRRSSTNNTYNNKDNDILSLNDNGADQLTYDSSFVRNGGGVGGNFSMRDDTSTLPSRESGYDHFIIQQQQQRNDEIKSLSDPVAMIHRSTQSTFVIAYGSNDDDEENSSNKLVGVRAMDTSKQKGQAAIEYIDIASISDSAANGENVDGTNVCLARNKRVCKTELSKDSSKQKRLRRYMCGLGGVLLILLAAFAATETTCAFILCQHVGFIPFPNNRSSSNKSSAVDDVSPPQQPKATPMPSAESISVVPTVTPSSLTIVRTDQPTTIEPTIVFTVEPTAFQVPSTAPPTPLTSPNISTLVLNTTDELYLAVDQYLLQHGNSSYNVTLPPIGEWDVSGIFNMTSLFSALRNPNARYFNANLSSWNTSRLIYMRSMFYLAESFNGDITTWDTSNVIDMYQTFTSAYKFNQDISSWNVGRVQEMSNMFRNCAQFNQNIGSWNTSSAIFMQGMFRNAPSFNQDLLWDTAEVINMAEMFEDADLFDGDVSKFNTSRVTDAHNMFRHALSFTGKNGLGLWQTYNMQDASQMFFGARSFAGVGISNWNIQSLQNPMLMFSGATSFNQDLCLNWHQPLMMLDGTLNMFAGTSCPHDDTPDPIYPSRSNTFCNICFTSTPPVIGTLSPSGAPYTGKAFITTDELRSAVDEYMIDDSPSSYVAFQYGYPIGYWDVSFLTDFSQVFDATRNSNLLRFNADLSSWNVSNAVNMYAMFQQTISFTDPNNGLAMWDVSKVTDMSGMFASSGFAGNISAWRVNNVIDFSYFAEFTPSFDSDLSTWNVSSATDMSWMFRASKAFNSNISNWNVRNVEDFSSMFAGAKIFNQDLCSWGSQVFDLLNTSSTTLGIPLIDVRNMFVATACPLAMEPNITSIVAGPWCTPCGW